MNFLRWNWLENGLLPLLLSLVRFAWLWPWLNLLPRALASVPVDVLLAPGVVIGLPLISFALARLAPTYEVPGARPAAVPKTETPWSARLGLGLLGLIACLLVAWWQLYRPTYAVWNPQWAAVFGYSLIRWTSVAVPIGWLLLLASLYLWLTGLLDAGKAQNHDDIWQAVVAGVWGLALYLVVMAFIERPLPSDFANLIVLFFGSSMLALALTSLKITVGLELALGFGQRRPVKAPATTRYWLLSVVLVVAVLLGLGVGLALLVAPEQVAQLLALAGAAIGLVWRLIALIIVAIAYVMALMAYYIALLLQPLIERLLAGLVAGGFLQPPQRPEATPTPETAPVTLADVPDPYRWLALVIFALLVIVIFAVVLRRLRAAQAAEIDEERESLLSAELLQSQLGALWQKLLGRFRSGAHALAPFLNLDGENETRRLIRSAYQGLLAAATLTGQSRPRAATPQEYQHDLTAHWHTSDDPLAVITAHYNHARYAPDPPSASAASAVQAAWATVQQQIEPVSEESPAPPDRPASQATGQ